jgi:hypothetical protein
LPPPPETLGFNHRDDQSGYADEHQEDGDDADPVCRRTGARDNHRTDEREDEEARDADDAHPGPDNSPMPEPDVFGVLRRTLAQTDKPRLPHNGNNGTFPPRNVAT